MPTEKPVSQVEAQRFGSPRRKTHVALLTSVLFVAAAVGISYSQQGKAASAEAKGEIRASQPARAASTLTLRRMPVERVVSVMGVAAPGSSTPVLVPRRDAIVAKVNVSEGDMVKAGDVLAELDDRFAVLDLRQSELLLREAQIQAVTASDRFELSKSALRRASDTLSAISQLVETGAAAPGKRETAALEVEQAETEYSIAASQLDQARNDVQLAEVAVERARMHVESHLIRATADGRVFGLGLREGEFPNAVGDGAAIVAGDDLDVVLDVPAIYLAELAVGEDVILQRGSGAPLAGKIKEVPVGLSEGKALASIKVSLNDPSGLMPGMSVVGDLVIGVEDAITVPLGALARRSDGSVAMRVASDGMVEEVAVRLGVPGDDGHVAVLQGLADGDVIIAQGAEHYGDGDLVMLKSAEQVSALGSADGMSFP